MAYDGKLIGERISLMRRSKKIKQETMSKSIGISQSYLSDIENGNTPITVENLYKISDVLNIPITWLLGEESNNDIIFTKEELSVIKLFKEFILSRRK